MQGGQEKKKAHRRLRRWAKALHRHHGAPQAQGGQARSHLNVTPQETEKFCQHCDPTSHRKYSFFRRILECTVLSESSTVAHRQLFH